MAPHDPSKEVQVGAQGRLVIRAPLRKALNIKPGDWLVARKVGDSLVLERRETIEKRLSEMFSHIPKEVSLVDELIAERRADEDAFDTVSIGFLSELVASVFPLDATGFVVRVGYI